MESKSSMESVVLGDTRITYEAGDLRLISGQLERIYRLTENGLRTVALNDLENARAWLRGDIPADGADWCVKFLADGTMPCTQLEQVLRVVTEDPFVGPHLEVIATFRYAYLDSHFDLRWRAWYCSHSQRRP